MFDQRGRSDPKWRGNWFRDKRNYVNFDGRTRVLTLHLPAGSDKSFCSLLRRGRRKRGPPLRTVSSRPSSFCSSDLFTRGGGGGCVNGVSTYSRSEVQIERKVTMRRSIQTVRNFDSFFEKIRACILCPPGYRSIRSVIRFPRRGLGET